MTPKFERIAHEIVANPLPFPESSFCNASEFVLALSSACRRLSLLVVFFQRYMSLSRRHDSDMQTTLNSEDEGAYSTDLPSSLELTFTSRVDNSKREDENDAGTCRRRST